MLRTACDGGAEASVEGVIEAEPGAGVVLDAHQRRASQPLDRPFVPLDDDIGDMGVSEDVKDVWRSIANSPGVGGVGTNGDPHNNWAKSFLLAVLDGREASCLKRGVLKAVGLHRCQDLRSDDIPHVVKRRTKDTVGSLGGDFEEAGSRRGDGEGVGLEIGTPHEFGRVAGDAVIPEVFLILGDQVGGDGEGV